MSFAWLLILLMGCIRIEANNETNEAIKTKLVKQDLRGCSFHLKNVKYIKSLNQTAQVLFITFQLPEGSALPEDVLNSTIFEPLEWKRITGTEGKGIIQLRPNFDVLSLNFLSFQTKEEMIEIGMTPTGCISGMTALEYQTEITRLILKYTPLKTDDEQKDEACDTHVKNVDGVAKFYHRCCKLNANDALECEDVYKNRWIRAIDICTYVVIALFVLYCPILIPDSFIESIQTDAFQYLYAPKNSQDEIVLRVKEEDGKKYVVSTLKDNKDGLTCGKRKDYDKKIPASKFEEMPHFKKMIKKSGDNTKLKAVGLIIRVPSDELVSSKKAPSGLFANCYESLFQCKIRRNVELSECCHINVISCCCTKLRLPWWRLLRFLMKIVLAALVCTPWIIRVFIFYYYEEEIRQQRLKAANQRGLDIGLHESLTFYITPIHVLFIGCYTFAVTSCLLFQLFNGTADDKQVKMVLRRFLRKDILKEKPDSKYTYIYSYTQIMKNCGFCGLFLCAIQMILLLPIILLQTAKWLFPTVRIILVFLGILKDFLDPRNWNRDIICQYNKPKTSYDEEKGESLTLSDTNSMTNSRSNEDDNLSKRRFYNTLIVLALLLACFSFVLLAVEMIILLIQVAIYTLIGCILNSSHAMQYISVISLAWFYYRNCFGQIDSLYQTYNKALHRIMYSLNKSQINEIAKKDESDQRNAAFKTFTRQNLEIDENKFVIETGTVPSEHTAEGDTVDGCISGEIVEQGKPDGHKPPLLNNSNAFERGFEEFFDSIQKFKNDRLDIDKRNVKLFAKRISLFLDRTDKLHITKELFFDACEIEGIGPGRLVDNLICAFKRFLTLVIFLAFVFIVVMGFGDLNDVSFTKQLFATVAGGFVPWILMKADILFSKKSAQTAEDIYNQYIAGSDENEILFFSDTTSIVGNRFRSRLDQIIDKQTVHYPVLDIKTEEVY